MFRDQDRYASLEDFLENVTPTTPNVIKIKKRMKIERLKAMMMGGISNINPNI